MKQLKINADLEAKAVAAEEEKVSRDRMLKCKNDTYKRNIDTLKGSIEHIDKY